MSCQHSCTPMRTEHRITMQCISSIFLLPTWKCAALAGYLGLRLSTYMYMVILLGVASVRNCFTKSAWIFLLLHLSNNLTYGLVQS